MQKVTAAEPNQNSRVLMLGIDAMSLPFVRAHLDHLPTLRALMERGVLVEPESTGKHFSASTWPSFASGKSVGELGQYFPFQWDAKHLKQRRLTDSAWRDQFAFEPFWHEFERRGVKSTVLDVGFVLNDKAAPCRQISNWSYQETSRAESSDPTLLAEIRRRFGDRPIGREVPVPKKKAVCLKIRDQMIEALSRKTDAILWLMDRYEWQLFLAGFYEAHRAGHNLWPIAGAFASETDTDSLLDVYKALDSQFQRIVERAMDARTTLIIFALHGMAPNRAQDHFLPKIMARLNARYLAEHGASDRRTRSGGLASWLRKIVPWGLQLFVASLVTEPVQDWVVNRTVFGGIDWSRTPAFHVSSGGEGYLRLNIKGREAQGFFEPDGTELRQYVHWLEDALLQIRVADSGEPLISKVLRTNDIFPGPKTHLLPDLLLKWAPKAPVEHIWSEKIGHIHERLRTGRGGNHADGSFVLVTGPGASNDAIHEMAHIKDIGRFVRSCFESLRPMSAKIDFDVSKLSRVE